MRAGVAVALALITGVFAAARVLHEPHWPTDFDQLWHAAHALRDGKNPYSVVGPGREFGWGWPLYFPLPAVMLSLPFTLLPIVSARIAFSAVAAGLLGWALGSRIRTHWPLLLSASFIISASRNQWAPLLLAATFAPALGFFAMAKPNLGLACLAAQNRRGLILVTAGCLVMVVVSFLVRPDWFASWSDVVRTSEQKRAAMTVLPVGPLLGLAALRWKRPESRVFLALVLTPLTGSLYDLLLLFYVARDLRESLIIAVLTQCLFWGIVLFASFPTFDAYAAGLGRAAIYVVYLPVLVLILMRPNEFVDTGAMSPRARSFIPTTWTDAILSSLLFVTATGLVWLPLITFRSV